MSWAKIASKSRPGMFYYFNPVTQKTTWKVPPDFKSDDDDVNKKAKVETTKTLGKSTAGGKGIQSHRKSVSSSSAADKNKNKQKAKTKTVKFNIEESKETGPHVPKEVHPPSPHPKPSKPSRLVINGGNAVHLQTNSNNCSESSQPFVLPEEEAMDTEERWGDEEVIDMDVDMTEEEQMALISEIKSTRSHLPLASSVGSLGEQRTTALTSTKLYLVLDTNILISHLGFLRDLKDYAIKSVGRPVLVIPWVVMQELDALKTSSRGRLAEKARDAIRFLHDCFQSRHPRVRGQTMEEVQTELKNIAICNNDDRILHCCLLYQKKVKDHGGTVILFSNDVQLSSKAMVNQVRALHRKTLLNELRVLFKSGSPSGPLTPVSPYPPPVMQDVAAAAAVVPPTGTRSDVSRDVLEDLLCDAESVVGTALSAVIYKEMVEAYSDLWEAIVVIKPPWQFKDTVKMLDKHWVAVFGTILPGHVHRSSVIALVKHVTHRDRIIPTVAVLDSFLTNSMVLLRAFAQVSGYNGVLPQSISHIATLTDRLSSIKSGTYTVGGPVQQTSTSHVISPVEPIPTDPRRQPSTSHVTRPQPLPLITSLLRPSCDDIIGLVGVVPTPPMDQLKWILDTILAITKHCHSRILLTLQNNPDSLSDKQEAGVFLSQLHEILQSTTSAIRKLLVTETTREVIREMLLSFQVFLHTTLFKNCPITMDEFIQCVRESSTRVQHLLVEALSSFSAMLGALEQLPKDLGL